MLYNMLLGYKKMLIQDYLTFKTASSVCIKIYIQTEMQFFIRVRLTALILTLQTKTIP
jgi:hypothetical protein